MLVRALTLIACSILSACSITKVHVFTESMTEEEVAFLEEVLTDNGYEVRLNSLPIPEGIVAPTIVYSPVHRSLKDVEALRDLLEVAGLDVDLEALTRTNHFYTGQNVGLYPRRYDPDLKRGITLVGKELFGECPDVDATLSLKPDFSFTAQFFLFDESTQSENVRIQEGAWRRYKQQLVLVPIESGADSELPFDIVRVSAKTDYGKIDSIKLVSSSQPYKTLERCEFVYREMDPW